MIMRSRRWKRRSRRKRREEEEQESHQHAIMRPSCLDTHQANLCALKLFGGMALFLFGSPQREKKKGFRETPKLFS